MTIPPDSFEARRAALFALGMPEDIYGGSALFALASGRDAAAANASLRRTAEWFDHPHPNGRDLRGEPDFAAIKLARVWHLFPRGAAGPLEEATRERIARFFVTYDFASLYQSENHAFLFHASRLLMGAALPGETFAAYRDGAGKPQTGAEVAAEDAAWLKRYLRYRAGHGWGEFDSPAYLVPDWESLSCLFDFSPDAELKRLAVMMLDLLYADLAVDSLGAGWYGGAHGRIYPPQALDHEAEPTALLHYVYFGGKPPAASRMHPFLGDVLTCGYRPHPRVADLALNRTAPYENRERKHLHNVADVLPREPLAGSLRKYTYWTPAWTMGAVQFQDAYPADCPCHGHHGGAPVEPDQRRSAGYAHHQQHQWDLSFATRPDARLFTHHPGDDPSHNEWTGDRLCGCGHFFQHEGALAALYDIPASQPRQYIHACVPRATFDEVVEEGGAIFVRAGEAYAALLLSEPFRWTAEGEWKDREVVSHGPLHAVVCEAASAGEYPEGFGAFRREIAGNAVRFDRAAMALEYRSARHGLLRLDTRGGRWLDGKAVDLDYPLYGSPHLRSDWGSGLVRIGRDGADPLVLDFRP